MIKICEYQQSRITFYIKVFVPLSHDGDKGWIFKLVCPGNAMSVSHERLLLLKNATKKGTLGFDDVCGEKRANVAYFNEPGLFEVNNITFEMVKGEKYPVYPAVGFYYIAWEWETQEAFFKYNNITPQWFNVYDYIWETNETWGRCNEWKLGAYFIQRGVADYAVPAYGFQDTYCPMATFSPSTNYAPYYWLTRYPLEHPPTWNLLRLFTKGSTNKHINIKTI